MIVLNDVMHRTLFWHRK